MKRMSIQQLRTADTLDALARHYDLDDGDLATMVGMSRAAVQHRRGGRSHPRTPLTIADLERFAEAFGVTTEVLLMEPAEAISWVIAHVAGAGIPCRVEVTQIAGGGGLTPSDQGFSTTIWTGDLPGRLSKWSGTHPGRRRHLAAVSA